MKLQRFFIKQELKDGGEVNINDADFVHQIFHVFRKKAGDEIILLDNTGYEFLAEIVSLNKKEANLNILNKKEVLNICKNEVILLASLIKKDKFEWVLEKCTELGVSGFVPVISERSEKKGLNIERARKIIKEASEQSERGRMPEICEPIDLEEALKGLNCEAVALHLNGGLFNIEKLKSIEKVGLFVGPEGGWGERDIAIFEKNNIPLITLGSQVLRAETASVAVSSKLLL
ncbi:MAG: RsmE family RNA methyltransferase [archaeon]